MRGGLMTVTLRSYAIPHAIHTPIPIPLYWEEPVREDLLNDVAIGIFEFVASTAPNIWCSRMVVLSKMDGIPCRTIDLQKLTAATVRHTHHTPSPFQQVIKIPSRMLKTDTWNGYHCILPAESAFTYFTFICSQGRFRYKRCP